jgi:hypothetical protein
MAKITNKTTDKYPKLAKFLYKGNIEYIKVTKRPISLTFAFSTRFCP